MSRTRKPLPLKRGLLLGLFFLQVLCVGCSKQEGISVSGTVNFEGAPVPLGMIVFAPNRQKGSEGRNAMVDIKDGEILMKDRLVIGGPSRLQISTFDGVPFESGNQIIDTGKVLVAAQMIEVDLPKDDDAELVINIKKKTEFLADVDVTVN